MRPKAQRGRLWALSQMQGASESLLLGQQDPHHPCPCLTQPISQDGSCYDYLRCVHIPQTAAQEQQSAPGCCRRYPLLPLLPEGQLGWRRVCRRLLLLLLLGLAVPVAAGPQCTEGIAAGQHKTAAARQSVITLHHRLQHAKPLVHALHFLLTLVDTFHPSLSHFSQQAHLQPPPFPNAAAQLRSYHPHLHPTTHAVPYTQ